MKVLSIDIGVKNFAMCIEEFDESLVESYSKEFKSKFKSTVSRCDSNNKATEEYNIFLNKFMVETCRTIFLKKIDFSEDEKFDKNKRGQLILNNNIFYSIIKNLDKFKEDFDSVDYIIMEKQLKTNPNAQTIEHHVHAYFIHRYGTNKEIENFESRHKTRVLCCPKKVMKNDKLTKIDKSYRKKWTTDKVMNIMLDRKDNSMFDYIFKKNKSKADDLSDTICQAIAFILLRFVE